jgi:MoaD family protein
MEMKIRLFTVLKDIAGTEEISMTWRQGMTPRDLLVELKKNYGPMTTVLDHSFVAVNGRFADQNAALLPEDEVAVLPPVSGG